MALDHTREFFSSAAFDPLDLQKTSPAFFLTRWITHICAPTFVFLAGTGAFLATTQGKSKGELSWFLVTRGLWLVVLELTYVNWFGWSFNINFHWFGIQVIWAIGWSMIGLAGLLWLPRWAATFVGLMFVGLHNALDDFVPEGLGPGAILWRVLHAGGIFEIAPDIRFGVGYPLIPWFGVMATGYALGPLLVRESQCRRRGLAGLGIALVVLFVALRLLNRYGDPGHWSRQPNALFTVFSFVNCTKYPPSLCFLLMTLGPAVLLLAWFDRGTPLLLKPLIVFGRVPLFFYLVHLPVIHAVSLLAAHVRSRLVPASEAGFSLLASYLFWIAIVALLYPACRWFAQYKRTHRAAWLGYL